VERQFGFDPQARRLIRGMGAPPELLEVRRNTSTEFDVVYCGSISGRKGLIGTFGNLSARGFRIGVAGSASATDLERISRIGRLTYLGLLPVSEVSGLLAQARMGLHYFPDRYPFRNEISTKVIEYLVAGLPVISNRHPWIDEHSAQVGYTYIDLAGLPSVDKLNIPESARVDEVKARKMLWPEVLKSCGFVEFFESIASQ